MGDINIKQIENLRLRMKVLETLTVVATIWIGLAVYQKKEETVYYLVAAVVILFVYKYYTQFRLQIVIRDNGVGIEDSIKSKVFSPFFTTKPTAEAAGTGLYLSREVVLNHKGTIRIESEKDNYTEVMIALPIYN